MDKREERIRAVKDHRTNRLLIEQRYDITGFGYLLYTEQELKEHSVIRIPGVPLEEQLGDTVTVRRNVAAMVALIAKEVAFDLVDYKEARYIFAIIDTFLHAQARRLSGNSMMTLSLEMLDDFKHLELLANKMMGYMTVEDQIKAMKEGRTYEKQEKGGIAALFTSVMPDLYSTPTEVIGNSLADDNTIRGYRSPFTALTNSRGCNRVERFI